MKKIGMNDRTEIRAAKKKVCWNPTLSARYPEATVPTIPPRVRVAAKKP